MGASSSHPLCGWYPTDVSKTGSGLYAADPNLMVIINAAIANGRLSIPFADLPAIAKHDNTVLIAAANTYGKAPTAAIWTAGPRRATRPKPSTWSASR